MPKAWYCRMVNVLVKCHPSALSTELRFKRKEMSSSANSCKIWEVEQDLERLRKVDFGRSHFFQGPASLMWVGNLGLDDVWNQPGERSCKELLWLQDQPRTTGVTAKSCDTKDLCISISSTGPAHNTDLRWGWSSPVQGQSPEGSPLTAHLLGMERMLHRGNL